jgi:PAS domain S-box-containing protein
MRSPDRSSAFVIFLLIAISALSVALWYWNSRHNTEADRALEQTKDAFERLERERVAPAATQGKGDGVSAVPNDAAPAANPPAVVEKLPAASPSRLSNPVPADSPRASGLSRLDREEANYLLGALLLTTLIALTLAGSSYRLVQRERRARLEQQQTARSFEQHSRSESPSAAFPHSGRDIWRETAEHLHALMLQAPLATLVYTADGEIIEVNRAFTEITGYTKHDVPDLGAWFTRGLRMPAEQVDEAVARAGQTLSGPGNAHNIEIWTQTGEARTWSCHELEFMPAPDGRPTRVLMAVDITGQAQAESRLQQFEDGSREQLTELNALYATAPAGWFVLDAGLRFVRVSERMARFNQQPAASHLGHTLAEISPQLARAAEPALKQALQDGKPADHLSLQVAARGTHGPARVWSMSVHPLKDSGGRVSALNIVVDDITDLRGAADPPHQSEEPLKAIVNSAPAPVFVKDVHGRYVYANKAYESLAGVTLEQIRGRTDHEVLPRPLADKLHRGDEDAITANAAHYFDETVPAGNQRRVYSCAKFPLRDAQEKVYAVCGILTDITERRQAEDELRAEDLRYRAQVAAVQQALLVERDGRLVYANRAGLKLLGAANEEQVLGHPALEFVHAASHQALRDGLKHAVATEARLIRLDGSLVSVELEAAPYETPDERGLLITARDVTARLRADAALRENETRYRDIADTAPALVWLSDASGHRTYLSKRWHEYTDAEQGLGLGWLASVHPEDRQSVREALLHAAERREHFRCEYRLRRNDGTYRWILDTATPRSADDRFLGHIGSALDITERRQGEDAFRAEDLRHRAQMAAVPQAVLIERDGKLVYANRAGLKLLGAASEEQVLGHAALEFVHAASHQALRDGLRHTVATEARLIRLDGSLVSVELEAAPYETPDERGLLITARDVTERIRADAALRESETRYRDIADTAPALVWLGDASGYRTYLSKRWHDYTDAEQGLGLGWLASVHPEDRQSVREALLHAAERREPFRCEYRLRRNDGAYRWILDTATPRSGDDRFLGHIGSAIDITERRQAEEQLRESEERFKTVANQAPVLTWVDGAARCEFVNKAFLEYLGGQADAQLHDWTRYIHPADRAGYTQRYRAAIEQRTRLETQFRLRRADGEYRWMQVVAMPRLGTGGTGSTPGGYIGCCLDVTENRRAEHALREADRRKDEFLSLFALRLHEPLGPICNAAEILRATTPSKPKLKELSDMIVRQSRHLGTLVGDLLDLGRALRGEIELHQEPIELGSAVYAAIEAARPLVESRRHELGVNLNAARARVNVDAERLGQALANVINYAAASAPEGSRISLSVEEAASSACVRIACSGGGMTPEDLRVLFDLFPEEKRPAGEHDADTLGLVLAARLVALHGGSLKAASSGPGQGSEFQLSLPTYSAPAATSTDAHASNGGRRVLVVDDNVDAAQSLAMLLQTQGHEVHVAHDGKGALAAAQSFHPEVALLDISLPDRNGYDLAGELRTLPETRDAVLVALTGYGAPEDRQRSKAAGFSHHLLKPVEMQALQRIIAARA